MMILNSSDKQEKTQTQTQTQMQTQTQTQTETQKETQTERISSHTKYALGLVEECLEYFTNYVKKKDVNDR